MHVAVLPGGVPGTVELLDPELLSDSERVASALFELGAARRFSHPRLDPVLGAGVDRGPPVRAWVARPEVVGHPLFSLFGREPAWVQVSLHIVRELALVLAEAHHRGLIHGALGPGAIRVGADAQVFLRDLGLGPLLATSEARLPFRAPELWVEDVLTPRADVYGLGMVLMTCLLGRPPFSGGDPVAIRRAALEHRLPRIRATRPEVPAGIDTLCGRLCALDPEARPASVADALELIEAALGPSIHLVPVAFSRQVAALAPPGAELGPAREAAERRSVATTRTERRPSTRPRSPRLPPPPSFGPGDDIGRYRITGATRADGPIEEFSAVEDGSGRRARLRILRLDRQDAALGLPADQWRALFEQEVALALTLAHPSVTRVRDAGREKGWAFVAYAPWVGPTLAAAGAADPRAVLLDLARAIEHLHQRGVLASGLRPEAVRISPRGLAVLTDLDRLAPIGAAPHPRLLEGPSFLAPEYVTTRRHDPRSDLFVLGLLGYELITGTRAYRGLDEKDVLEAIRTRPPRRIDPGPTGADLTKIVEALMERDPARRPASAAEVAERLERRGTG